MYKYGNKEKKVGFFHADFLFLLLSLYHLNVSTKLFNTDFIFDTLQ